MTFALLFAHNHPSPTEQKLINDFQKFPILCVLFIIIISQLCKMMATY